MKIIFLLLSIITSSKTTHSYVIWATSNPLFIHGSIFRNLLMVTISLFAMTMMMMVKNNEKAVKTGNIIISFTDVHKDSMTQSSYMCQCRPTVSPKSSHPWHQLCYYSEWGLLWPDLRACWKAESRAHPSSIDPQCEFWQDHSHAHRCCSRASLMSLTHLSEEKLDWSVGNLRLPL